MAKPVETMPRTWDELLVEHVGWPDSDILYSDDRDMLMIAVLAPDEFVSITPCAEVHIAGIHRQRSYSPGLPRDIWSLEQFRDRYHSYIPQDGMVAFSPMVAKARARLTKLSPGMRGNVEKWTAHLAVENLLQNRDPRYRYTIEDAPVKACQANFRHYLKSNDVTFYIPSGDILDFNPGVRGGARRLQELTQGILSRVVQLNPSSFPCRFMERLLSQHTSLPYTQYNLGLAEGSAKLVASSKSGAQESFAATVMAESPRGTPETEMREAVKNAHTLTQEGGLLLLRERVVNAAGCGIYPLIECAEKYFGQPIHDSSVTISDRSGQQAQGLLVAFTKN